MGDVYLGFDNQIAQLVAIKILKQQEGDRLLQFKREFRALADVTHQNLVCLYDFVIADNISFFSMEYVQGSTMLHAVRIPESHHASPGTQHPSSEMLVEDDDPTTDLGILSSTPHAKQKRTEHVSTASIHPERLRDVLRQLATAIAALHQMGHLHRDIKPSNILVEHSGRVVVLDFGIISTLRISEERTPNDQLLSAGTPAYMAPELFSSGGAASTASDWYAFGTIIYQALAGRIPYQGSTALISASKLSVDVVPPATLCPNAPADLLPLCMALLQRDPKNRPTTEQILERLGAASSTVVHIARADTDTFVGRTNELSTLETAFEGLQNGAGDTILLRGQSGMGKSALCQYFLETLQTSADVVVLSGRCFQRESVPYKALDGVMDAAYHFLAKQDPLHRAQYLPTDMTALSRAFPVLTPLMETAAESSHIEIGQDWQRRAQAAVEDLLSRIAAHHPLVVSIEDLHWSDTDSVAFLLRLMGDGQLPLLFIGTLRSEAEEDSPALRAIREQLSGDDKHQEAYGNAHIIEVLPLEPAALQRLATNLLNGAGDTDLVVRIADEAAGSPYLLQELAHFVTHNKANRTLTDISLDSLITTRLNEVSEAARQLLQVVAVAGWRVPRTLVEQVSGLKGDRRRTLLELTNGRFLRVSEHSDALELYQGKVAEVATGHMSQSEVRAIHHALAAALDNMPRGTDTYLFPLAEHYALAADPEKKARCFEVNLMAAQRAANSYAFEQARVFYTQAHQAIGTDEHRADSSFYLGWGNAAALIGRNDEAAAALNSALEKATTPEQKAAALFALSRLKMTQLDSDTAATLIAQGLNELGISMPTGSLWRVILTLPGLYRRIRTMRRQDFSATVGADSSTLARTRLKFHLLSELSYIAYFQMDRIRMIQSTIGASRHGILLGPSPELIIWLSLSGIIAAIAGKPRWCISAFEYGNTFAKRLGDPEATARLQIFEGVATHFLGDVQDAQARCEHALTSQEHLLENQDYLTCTADLTWNLLMRGYAKEAWAWTERGLHRISITRNSARASMGHTFRCYAGPELAMTGNSAAGFRHLNEFRQLLQEVDLPAWHHAQHLAHRLWAMALAGNHGLDFDEVLSQWKNLRHNPKRIPQQIRHAYIAITHVMLTRLEGSDASRSSHRPAVKHAQRALKHLEQASGHPTLRAHLLVLQGKFYRIERESKRAETFLTEALELARQYDNPWVEYMGHQEQALLADYNNDHAIAAEHRQRCSILLSQHAWDNSVVEVYNVPTPSEETT